MNAADVRMRFPAWTGEAKRPAWMHRRLNAGRIVPQAAYPLGLSPCSSRISTFHCVSPSRCFTKYSALSQNQ